jgi:hypothetical protein
VLLDVECGVGFKKRYICKRELVGSREQEVWWGITGENGGLI